MKTTLAKPEVAHFNNADHIEFHTLSYKTCHEFGTVIDAPELLAAYDEKVKQEDRIYKWIRRSEFTQKKMEVDQQRDSAYLGILGIVRTCLKHFDPAIRDNALHVYNLLENYGDLTHAGYDAETAGIDSICYCVFRLRLQRCQRKFRDVSTNLVDAPLGFGGGAGKLYNEIVDIVALAPLRSRTVPKSMFPHHIIYGIKNSGFSKLSHRAPPIFGFRISDLNCSAHRLYRSRGSHTSYFESNGAPRRCYRVFR